MRKLKIGLSIVGAVALLLKLKIASGEKRLIGVC